MKKLIFINSDEIQDLTLVLEGGGCTDKSKEIWNENVDGPIDPQMLTQLGGLKRVGDKLEFDADLKAKNDKIKAECAEREALKQKEKDQRKELLIKFDSISDLDSLKATCKAAFIELGLI